MHLYFNKTALGRTYNVPLHIKAKAPGFIAASLGFGKGGKPLANRQNAPVYVPDWTAVCGRSALINHLIQMPDLPALKELVSHVIYKIL